MLRRSVSTIDARRHHGNVLKILQFRFELSSKYLLFGFTSNKIITVLRLTIDGFTKCPISIPLNQLQTVRQQQFLHELGKCKLFICRQFLDRPRPFSQWETKRDISPMNIDCHLIKFLVIHKYLLAHQTFCLHSLFEPRAMSE